MFRIRTPRLLSLMAVLLTVSCLLPLAGCAKKEADPGAGGANYYTGAIKPKANAPGKTPAKSNAAIVQ